MLLRAINYQESLFHEEAISNNGFGAIESYEFGEGGQQMHG